MKHVGDFTVLCQLDGMQLSLTPADGRGVGLSVDMSIPEAEGLVEALKAEIAAARARAAQAGEDLRRISDG